MGFPIEYRVSPSDRVESNTPPHRNTIAKSHLTRSTCLTLMSEWPLAEDRSTRDPTTPSTGPTGGRPFPVTGGAGGASPRTVSPAPSRRRPCGGMRSYSRGAGRSVGPRRGSVCVSRGRRRDWGGQRCPGGTLPRPGPWEGRNGLRSVDLYYVDLPLRPDTRKVSVRGWK